MRQLFTLAAETNDSAVPPRRVPAGYVGAVYLLGKSKRPCWPLARTILCLILIGPGLAIPLMESQTAWAATTDSSSSSSSSSAAPPDCTLIEGEQLTPVTCDTKGALQPTDCVTIQDTTWVKTDCLADPEALPLGNGSVRPKGGGELINLFTSLDNIIKLAGDVIDALVNHDLAGWITCMLTAGTVPCPTTSGTPWSLDCPIVDNNNNVIDATSSETIYEAAVKSQGVSARADWLSGDATKPDINAASSATQSEPGHLIYTYPADTISQPSVVKLSSFSLGLGIMMIGPLLALVGFQLLLSSVKLSSQRMNAMRGLGDVLLAAAIIGLSFSMIKMLIDLVNSINGAIASLNANASLSFSKSQTSTSNTAIVIGFSIPGDGSFRGVVIPMALWGCIIDDFIGLMASRAANMVGSGIPVVGGVLGITGRVVEILDLINDIGEFILFVLSVTIWGQAIARIFLLNYYIILAPVAFACWGLSRQQGSQIVMAWFKGFLQLLFMQTVQLFILVSMPSLMPDFGLMQFPHGGSVVNPPLQSLLGQLPVIVTTLAATGAPKVMMGIGPMNTVAKAGALAGKAVATAGMAINSMMRK